MGEQATTKTTNKVHFASAEWVDLARAALEELAAEHGDEGAKLSVCEIFTGAPAHVAESGTAAWYFVMDGKRVTVALGEMPDADVVIRADYETSLPGARAVYTPEYLAKMPSMPPPKIPPEIKGDTSAFPSWLVELHNRMAVVTA